jgi:hypothetical protein
MSNEVRFILKIKKLNHANGYKKYDSKAAVRDISIYNRYALPELFMAAALRANYRDTGN